MSFADVPLEYMRACVRQMRAGSSVPAALHLLHQLLASLSTEAPKVRSWSILINLSLRCQSSFGVNMIVG